LEQLEPKSEGGLAGDEEIRNGRLRRLG
jgi:hypothetical protein